ncbi:MAG: nucleotidyltransferase domain-containing protein [Anaerolineae bacterium]
MSEATLTRTQDEELIRQMVDTIVRQFGPLRVVLFGSRARGEARPDSDVDLLVVMPESTDRRGVAVAIGRALADSPLPKDIVVTTPEEIRQRGHLVGNVLLPALSEGRVLYDVA